jgi:hypothetical protein
MHHENHVKSIVQQQLARQGVTRWGIVDTYNPGTGEAKVKLQPDDVLTGWLPVAFTATGAASGMIPPSPGDQVVVHADCSDMENGIVAMSAHGGATQPPISPVTGKPPQPGEIWFALGPLYFHMTGGNIFMGGGDIFLNGSIIASGNGFFGAGGPDAVDVLSHTHLYTPGSGDPTQTAVPTAGS